MPPILRSINPDTALGTALAHGKFCSHLWSLQLWIHSTETAAGGQWGCRLLCSPTHGFTWELQRGFFPQPALLRLSFKEMSKAQNHTQQRLPPPHFQQDFLRSLMTTSEQQPYLNTYIHRYMYTAFGHWISGKNFLIMAGKAILRNTAEISWMWILTPKSLCKDPPCSALGHFDSLRKKITQHRNKTVSLKGVLN